MKKLLLSLLLVSFNFSFNFSSISQDCICEGKIWVGYWIDYSEPINDCDEITSCVDRYFFGFRWLDVDPKNCSPLINDCILPIELNYFNAITEGDNIIIYWETATEQNNDYFTIYKSYNGIYWEIIEEVIGAGNSNSSIKYEIIDSDLKSGTIYYKLTQTDFNGDFEEFDIVSIDYIKNELIYTIYNTKGEIVEDNYNGIKVYKYSDGSFKRILQIK